MLFERIKMLCAEKGITVWRLERELGFSNGSISKWSTTSPSVEKVKAVAEYFGITVDDLIREVNT